VRLKQPGGWLCGFLCWVSYWFKFNFQAVLIIETFINLSNIGH
jgi:hypothetical protein